MIGVDGFMVMKMLMERMFIIKLNYDYFTFYVNYNFHEYFNCLVQNYFIFNHV